MPADQPAGPSLAHAATAGPSDVLTPDDGHAVAALLSRPRSSDLRLEYGSTAGVLGDTHPWAQSDANFQNSQSYDRGL
jgi:hypothetical protein